MASIAKFKLPVNSGTRLQALLDEGDQHWFARHPDEPSRSRMYFLGEKIDGTREPARYVLVSRDADGTLTRRFEQEGGQA